MSTTLSTLRNDAYAILNEPSTSDLYASDFVDLELNNVQVQVCDGQNLKFLRSSTTFLAPVASSLSSSITTSSTVISTNDTTNWDSAGAVWIDGDIISYTAKTSTTLTGVTGISVSHSSGVLIYPLKSLPSDYWKTPELRTKKSSSLLMERWTYYDELEWYNRMSNFAYSLVFSGTSTYLLIDGVSTSDVMLFYYDKYPTYMTDDSDTATIPDPYARNVIPTLTAARCMLLRGDDVDNLGSKLKALGEQELFKMYKKYGSSENAYRQIVQCDYKSRIPRTYSNRRRTTYYY